MTKFPLVGDYSGNGVNTSFKSIGEIAYQLVNQTLVYVKVE